MPPSPTSANWPSESWPAQPVSTVRERATSAIRMHPGVQEVARRCRDEERQRERGEQRQAAGDPSVVPDPPDALQRGRDGADARSEGERARAIPSPRLRMDDEQHGDEHDDQQHAR